MPTAFVTLYPEDAQFLATIFPQYIRVMGTNFPVSGLAFDAATQENCYWKFEAQNYASGNLTFNLIWYADTASTGNVIWGASIGAITPETDTQDVETKALATAIEVTDSHLGTTGQRLHRATITISNLDSIAASDVVFLRLYRKAADGGDTMTGDAIFMIGNVTFLTT